MEVLLMRALGVVLSIALGVVAGFVPDCEGQDSLARLVFNDCPQARAVLQGMSSNERAQQYSMLAKVLELSTQVSEIPEAFAVLPGTPPRPSELGPATLWQSVDARRELEGKRCALQLLGEAGSEAAPVLKDLVELYTSQGFSDEIGVGLEEVVADIAERASRQGFRPSQLAVETFVGGLSKKYPLVAETVLIEFYRRAAPNILVALASAEGGLAERLLSIIRQADSSGLVTSETIVRARAVFPEGAIRQLLAKLPLPIEAPSRALVSDVVGVSTRADLALLLGRLCRARGDLEFSADDDAALAANPTLLDKDYLPLAEQTCLVASSDLLAGRVLPMLLMQESTVVKQGLSMLPSALRRFTQEQRRVAYEAVDKVLGGELSDITPKAVVTAALLKEHSADLTKRLSAVIAKLSTERRSPAPEGLMWALTDAALALGRSDGSERFDDVMAANLSNGRRVDESARWLLAGAGKKSQGRFWGLIRTVDARTAETMIRGLLSSSSVDKSVLKQLVDATERPEIAPIVEGEIALRADTLGPEVLSFLGKVSTKASPTPLVLKRALVTLPNKTNPGKPQKEPLLSALAKAPCIQLTTRGALVAELLDDPNAGDDLVERVLGCLTDSSVAAAAKLSKAAVTGRVLSSQGMANFLTSPAADPEIVESILDAAVKANLSGVQASRLVLLLLENADVDVRRRVVSSPIVGLATDPAVGAQILRQYQQLSEDDLIETSYLIALSRLQSPEVDWGDVMKRCAVGFAQGRASRFCDRVLGNLNTEILMTEIGNLLESRSQEARVGSLRVAVKAGEKVLPLLPKLELLVGDPDPELRYNALLAVLRIEPQKAGFSEWVRRLLVNRFFDVARRSEIPWSSTLAVAGLNPREFGMVRSSRLKALLSRNVP